MGGHVFISYVHEDKAIVERLQRALERAGISVWRDVNDLPLGMDWRAEIRRAITQEALVFLACFSEASVNRARTEQRAEIVLAIDEYRRRRPDRAWLIPVRLSDVTVPDYELGNDKPLAALTWVDVFGPHWKPGTTRLIADIQKLLPPGAEPPTPSRRQQKRRWLGTLAVAAVLVASLGAWRMLDDSETHDGSPPSSTVPTSSLPPSDVLATCGTDLPERTSIRPGSDPEAAGDLELSSTVSYSASITSKGWTSIHAFGRMTGSVPDGKVVYLLAAPHAGPGETPTAQDHYFLVKRLEPQDDGCWFYWNDQVGYQTMCDVTSVFVIALISDRVAQELETEKADPASSADADGFPPERMAAPSVGKLATFAVPIVRSCS